MKALALVFLAGCASFSNSRSTCVGKVDSPQEAAQLVAPHLANAMLCASKNVSDDAAAKACVMAEFEAMRAEATPVVYQCAVALVGDAAAAAK